jgi:phenylacetate-CoA ligase
VQEPGYTAEDEQRIRSETRRRLGKAIAILFDYVSDIPRTKNGKFRFIISNLGTKKVFSKPLSSETS